MARGLSPLQRFILARAGEVARVFTVDVLEGYYGWRPAVPIHRWGPTYPHPIEGELPTPPELVGTVAAPGVRRFSRRAVGGSLYHKVLVTVGRAARLLEGRGLVRRVIPRTGPGWVEITDEGREMLRKLEARKHPASGESAPREEALATA